MTTASIHDDAGRVAGEVGKTESSKQANSTQNDNIFPARSQESDPIIGWYGLAAGAKESRHRKMKRGWQRGSGDYLFMLLIALLIWAGVLLGGSI